MFESAQKKPPNVRPRHLRAKKNKTISKEFRQPIWVPHFRHTKVMLVFF